MRSKWLSEKKTAQLPEKREIVYAKQSKTTKIQIGQKQSEHWTKIKVDSASVKK